MRKVQVDAKTASNFMAQGYDVEHFVCIPDPPKANGAAEPTKRYGANTIVTLSFDGREPVNGNYGVIWPKAKDKIWGKDPTKQITRGKLVEELEKAGNEDPTMASYLINKCQCVRVVSDGGA